MVVTTQCAPAEWAQSQFGQAALGDQRRTRRAVQVAAQMLARPDSSIPRQAGIWSATKASYRLFDEPQVTFEAVSREHWRLTRTRAAQRAVTLMIEDTSELDYTAHPAITDLGPIGNGGGSGLLLHSTLAVDPSGVGEVLGLAYQMVLSREPVPAHETATQRKARERESRVWAQSVAAVGAPAGAGRFVHVCDRGADNFEMFEACRLTAVDFVIRAAQDRRCVAGHVTHVPES